MAVPMRLFPGEVPRHAEVGPFRLAALTVDDLLEDYLAVVESAADLEGVFGDGWPGGLTIRQNLADLGWHEVEFQRGTSFAWIIRDAGGRYAGCAYIRPASEGGETVRTAYWFRSSFTDGAAIDAFDGAWRAFVGGLGAADVVVNRRSRYHRQP